MATKIYVSSVAIPLISDTPNIVRDSVIGAVTAKREFCMDTLLVNYNNCIVNKANNFLSYAQQRYALGLPGGTMEYGQGEIDNLVILLSGLAGEPIKIVSNAIYTFTAYTVGRQLAQSNYGWNSDTNLVSAPPFARKEPTSKVELATIYLLDKTHLRFGFTEKFGVGYSKSQTVIYDQLIPEVVSSDLWYQTVYQPVSGGQEMYWAYNTATGVYPQLALPNALKMESPFYPIIPLRLDNKGMADDNLKDTPLYKSSKQLLNKMGMDIDGLCASIEENPDIAGIDHAFIFVGTILQSKDQASIRYMAEFFAYMFQLSGSRKAEYEDWINSVDSVISQNIPKRGNLIIEDSKFKIELSFNYIDLKVLDGAIGSEGFATRENIVSPPHNGSFGNKHETSRVIFRKQISATQYTELVVHGLVHTNHIYKGKVIVTTVAKSLEEDNSDFIIPLNRFVVKELPFPVRAELYYQTFHLVLNSFEEVKLKWYQTGIFRAVIMIVAIIVTIYTLGQTWQTVVAAAAAGTLAVVLVEIAINILIGLLIAEGLKILAKAIGPEFTAIIALIMTVVAVTGMIKADSVKGAPWAEELLKVSQALVKANTAVLRDELTDVMTQMDQFTSDSKQNMEELEKAQKLLENTGNIDPMEFVGLEPMFIPIETPDEFYFRTVHAANIGVIALDAISNYVESALTLPRINNSLA